MNASPTKFPKGSTQFHNVCWEVINFCPNEYAKAYAKAGLLMNGSEIPNQALYILSNTSNWRGEVARKTKAKLREYTSG